ncbi:Orotidine 5'-phosphate decarboxylase domain-containing protein [Bisporella sp. PMI_857]|nr:Orotidine 5'-phosphate decarboxylase domain-containing protein [Bisporella sp. PMI_857]
MSTSHPHHVTTTSFSARAERATHPLSNYLLRLMSIKKSNLCLSADVSTTNQLLYLADTIGPFIVVLKTHYDLINNWDYNPSTGTGAKLARLARRHGFLIFEDRKFGDIGNTVQLQYTEGSARIIEWSHITNVEERKRYEVKTDISVGTPRPESVESDDDESSINTPIPEENGLDAYKGSRDGRKASIVSITTNFSQHFEPANSPRNWEAIGEEEVLYPGIEEAPLERGLLILAQMSSVGNFMTGDYTESVCREREGAYRIRDGFRKSGELERGRRRSVLSMTPGCQLPPEEADDEADIEGDGKGQQYNTPKKLVGALGNDVVIVGRGIIKAANPRAEAERYRRSAWAAYEERVKG